MKEYSKNCVECKVEFLSNSLKAKFCSNSCKSKEWKNSNKKQYRCICKFCERNFISNSCYTKFCSKKCSGLYKNRTGIGVGFCKGCESEYNMKHIRHLFCSKSCKQKYQNRKLEKVLVSCSNCKKEIERSKYLIDKQSNFFCSRKCDSEFKRKEADDIRICETCENSFKCKKGDKLRFCSYACQGIWQSKHRSGKNHPSYNHKIEDIFRLKKCEYCKIEMFCQPAEFRVKKFCSRECMLKGMKFSLTTPHILICNLLDTLNVNYTVEERLGRYSFDCFDKDKSLAFEIMGTFYHCDIRFYSNIINEIQTNSIKRDFKKQILSYEKDIPILYLWEYDVNNNLKLCKKLILKYIKRNGILDNYHSMNYSLLKNKLILNEKILVPYFERK